VKPPKAPFEVTIRINAEDWDYVCRVVAELAEHLKDHADCSLAAGGGGGSHSVKVEKMEISREKYRRELSEWFDAFKASRSGGDGEGSVSEGRA
jgi:hypothetical protein